MAHPIGDRAAGGLGVLRVLQHERALQIAGTVKPGRQPEMALEQCARLAEQIKKLVAGHSALSPFAHELRRTPRGLPEAVSVSSNSLRIRRYSSAQLVSSSKPWFSTGKGANDQCSFRSSISRCTRRTES